MNYMAEQHTAQTPTIDPAMAEQAFAKQAFATRQQIKELRDAREKMGEDSPLATAGAMTVGGGLVAAIGHAVNNFRLPDNVIEQSQKLADKTGEKLSTTVKVFTENGGQYLDSLDETWINRQFSKAPEMKEFLTSKRSELLDAKSANAFDAATQQVQENLTNELPDMVGKQTTRLTEEVLERGETKAAHKFQEVWQQIGEHGQFTIAGKEFSALQLTVAGIAMLGGALAAKKALDMKRQPQHNAREMVEEEIAAKEQILQSWQDKVQHAGNARREGKSHVEIVISDRSNDAAQEAEPQRL